ncbi:MAG: tetratricopeptide repeat protein [Maricaulaceae bacterium]
MTTVRLIPLLSVALAVVSTAPVGAAEPLRLKDVRAAVQDDKARLLFEFSAPLSKATAKIDGEGRVCLPLPGVDLAAVRVEPAGRAPIKDLEVFPTPTGAEVRFAGVKPVNQAFASVKNGALVVDLAFQGKIAQPLSLLAAASPRPAPPPAPKAPAAAKAARPAPKAAAKADPKAAAPSKPTTVAKAEPTSAAKPDPAPKPAAAPEKPRRPKPKPAAVVAVTLSYLTDEVCRKAAAGVAADEWAVDALADHAGCLARAGDLAAAREVFDRLLAFDPFSVDAHIGRAALYAANGEKARAREDLAEARALGPSDGQGGRILSIERVLSGAAPGTIAAR